VGPGLVVSGRLDRAPPALAIGDVHLWDGRTNDLLRTIDAFDACLDAKERARARRFQRPDRRRRYVVAHGVQRAVLAAYLDIDPQAVRFRIGSKGKPFIDHLSDLSCSLSYSGDRFIIAVGRSQLGVDIEEWTSFTHGEVMASAFSPAERAYVEDRAPHDRRAAFFAIWTRKEAYLKATGAGIGDDLRHIDVVADAAGGLQIRSIDVGPDTSGALAATALRQIEHFRLRALPPKTTIV
jgi:4'-phosphopantetheinyl transferase